MAQLKIEAASELLQKSKTAVNDLLKEDHPALALTASSSLDQLINRVHFVGGLPAPGSTRKSFPPVTNFMGEDITIPKKIEQDELSPDEAEKQTFIQKVEKLYEELPSLAPDGILNAYTLPEDQLVLRGVAKRAGVDDYNDRELNIPFIEDINQAIKDKEAEDKKEKEIEAQLKKEAEDKKEKETKKAANKKK